MPDNCPILEAHGIKLNDKQGGAEICRNCPLEKCIYDAERDEKRDRQRKKVRDQEIIRLFITEEKRIRELALMFNISQKTVQRAIKDYRRREREEKPPFSPGYVDVK